MALQFAMRSLLPTHEGRSSRLSPFDDPQLENPSSVVLNATQLRQADPLLSDAAHHLGLDLQARDRTGMAAVQGCRLRNVHNGATHVAQRSSRGCSESTAPCWQVQGLSKRDLTYIRRNYWQAKEAQAVYAVGRIQR